MPNTVNGHPLGRRALTRTFRFLTQAQTEDEPAAGEDEQAEPVELFTTPATKMAAATSDFGYNLFRALASQQDGANVFLAPIGVSAVLTQLTLGEHFGRIKLTQTFRGGLGVSPGRLFRCLRGASWGLSGNLSDGFKGVSKVPPGWVSGCLQRVF